MGRSCMSVCVIRSYVLFKQLNNLLENIIKVTELHNDDPARFDTNEGQTGNIREKNAKTTGPKYTARKESPNTTDRTTELTAAASAIRIINTGIMS